MSCIFAFTTTLLYSVKFKYQITLRIFEDFLGQAVSRFTKRAEAVAARRKRHSRHRRLTSPLVEQKHVAVLAAQNVKVLQTINI